MNKLPNLLIVGAAKSGTTSLHNYLNQHPAIFMSPVKEPKYFSSQVVDFPFGGKGDNLAEQTFCKTLDSYKAVFSDHTEEKILGESSADNLYYSNEVIPLIKELLGEKTKIIILLRNPLERAFSAYMHLKRDLRENKKSFSSALSMENDRIKTNYEFIWHYKSAGLYHQDVKNYLESFESVKVILSEDFQKNTKEVLKETCSFLEVNPDFDFLITQKYNRSGEVKNQLLQRILVSNSKVKKSLGKIVPKNLVKSLKSKNIKTKRIPTINKKELSLYYKKDIQQLEKLLNEDLSRWLK